MVHTTTFILAILAAAPAASETTPARMVSVPDSRLGIRTAPLLLLSRPDVRADLGVNAEQTAAAEAMILSLHDKANRLKGMTGEAAVAARRAIDEEQARWLESELTDLQRSRLTQIDLQWEGPAALATRPALADVLNLTPDQRTSLKEWFTQSQRKRAQGNFGAGDEAALARQALATLSVRQRENWKAMLGTPFTPQLAGNGTRRAR